MFKWLRYFAQTLGLNLLIIAEICLLVFPSGYIAFGVPLPQSFEQHRLSLFLAGFALASVAAALVTTQIALRCWKHTRNSTMPFAAATITTQIAVATLFVLATSTIFALYLMR